MAAQEFECGYFCEFSLAGRLVVILTSLPVIGYAAYLERTKSRNRHLQVVRLLTTIFMVFRDISVLVPNTLAGHAITATPAHVALYAAYFEWQKTVVEVSYQAVKLSSKPPIWVWRYTRIHQVVCLLALPVLYGLGGSPSGNPRCSTVQAITSAYLYIPSVSIGVSIIFALFVVSKHVSRVAREVHSAGAGNANAKKLARYGKALRKIRWISIFISFLILMMTFDLIKSFTDRGEPTVTCGGIFADTIFPLVGNISSVLILWSTSVSPDISSTPTPSPQGGGSSSGGKHHSRHGSRTQQKPGTTTKICQRVSSMTLESSMSPTPVGTPAHAEGVSVTIPEEALAEESIVVSEVCVSSLSGSPAPTNA